MTVRLPTTRLPGRLVLRERCWGCGTTRLVDIDPPWRGYPHPFSLDYGWAFCDDCFPRIDAFLVRNNETFVGMFQVDRAFGRPSWFTLNEDKIPLRPKHEKDS